MLGTLLDLIEIDAGWEPAVEAALGESLTAVVVDDPSAGRRALDALRTSDTSGAVIALGTRPAGQPRPGVGDAVRPHARSSRPGVDALLDGLLGSAVRVDDLGRSGRCRAEPSRCGRGHSSRRPVRSERLACRCCREWRHRCSPRRRARTGPYRHRRTRAGHRSRRCRRAHAATQPGRPKPIWCSASTPTTHGSAQHRKGSPRPSASTARPSPNSRTSNGSIDDVTANIVRDEQRISELEALLPALESDEQAEADAARARGELRAELETRAAALASRRKDLEVRNAGLARASAAARTSPRRNRTPPCGRCRSPHRRRGAAPDDRTRHGCDRSADRASRRAPRGRRGGACRSRRAATSAERRGARTHHRTRCAASRAQREGTGARRITRTGAAGRARRGRSEAPPRDGDRDAATRSRHRTCGGRSGTDAGTPGRRHARRDASASSNASSASSGRSIRWHWRSSTSCRPGTRSSRSSSKTFARRVGSCRG